MTSDLRLYAIVLRLAALRPGAIPADHGDQARAALFDLIKRGDLQLSEKLHDENVQKPYTISLLDGGKRDQRRTLHFGEGDSAEWRFTLLHEPAFEALLRRYLLNRTLPHVRIGAVEFAIVDAFASGLSHPDCSHVGVLELQDRWNCDPETLSNSITLDFCSPTTFHLGTDRETAERMWRTFPYPRTLFSSLRKRWQGMGGLEPGDDFDVWVERHIDVEPINLMTYTTFIEGNSVQGFVGRVRFRQRGDKRWLSLVHLLADLTFWTGVGYQTTRGLGQVRRLTD
jgi:CRISPR-associated endoribonuclease Cas6